MLLLGLLLCCTNSCIKDDGAEAESLKDLEPDPKDLYNIKISSFPMKSKVPGNSDVTCYYTRPYKKDGTLAPRADTVVYYAHYPMEKNYYKIPDKKHPGKRIFIDLARQLGFTVFSVDFANSPIGPDVSNRKVFYYYPESGSFETILQAYDKILEKENMPFSKFFITGLSGGPSMAVNFINTYPDKIDALALFAGHRYVVPLKKNSAAWLIQHTLHSHTTKKNNTLAEGLRRNGKYPILVETMPNWQLRGQSLFNHCENWNAKNMMYIFLSDVADLRRENDNIMPHETKWPYVISLSDKTKLLKNNGQKLPFKDPLYMPSKRFYEEYMKVIPEPLKIKLSKHNKMIIGITALGSKTPKGIVINLNAAGRFNAGSLDYDARFFADNGYLYLNTLSDVNIKTFKKILTDKFNSLLQVTPIFIIANKQKTEGLDFNIKNCAKVIIYCDTKTHFEKIKPEVKKIIDANTAVTLIVHSEKLSKKIAQELGQDSNSLSNVIYSKAKKKLSPEIIARNNNNQILKIINKNPQQTTKTANSNTTISPK